jgi:hypothetical protein
MKNSLRRPEHTMVLAIVANVLAMLESGQLRNWIIAMIGNATEAESSLPVPVYARKMHRVTCGKHDKSE